MNKAFCNMNVSCHGKNVDAHASHIILHMLHLTTKPYSSLNRETAHTTKLSTHLQPTLIFAHLRSYLTMLSTHLRPTLIFAQIYLTVTMHFWSQHSFNSLHNTKVELKKGWVEVVQGKVKIEIEAKEFGWVYIASDVDIESPCMF